MNRVARGCSVVAGVALVGFAGFAAYAIIQFDSTMHDQSPPDVAKIATSAQVTAADQLATTRMDADLAEVTAAGTGTEPGPSAVLDQCQSRRGGMWVETWSPVGCTRRVTAYFAFNGDFEHQMQTWSAALAAKGWRGENDDALAQPQAYSGQLCKRSGSGDPTCLHFDWTERPKTKDPLYSVSDLGETVIRQRHDVDPAQTESADFAGARYVAIVTMSDSYYTPTIKPTQPSTASPPNPSYSPCYSGSHNCY